MLRLDDVLEKFSKGVVTQSRANLTSDLLKAIPRFIQRENSRDLGVSGETINRYTNLLEETLKGLAKYQNTDYTNV